MKDLQSDYRVTFRLMMKEAKHKYGNDIEMIITRTYFVFTTFEPYILSFDNDS